MKFVVALLFGLLAAAQPALAQGPLSATLDARKVVTVAGQETFSTADSARPNDVIEYRTVYRNVSKGTLRHVAGTLPVPHGFEFIAGSAGKTVLASLDGKTFAPVPLTRRVKGADGREQIVAVPASEYRFLRWPLGDMAATSSQVVSARMRMADSPAVVVSC